VATKLVWSGDRIATLVDGRARLHDAGGALVQAMPFAYPVIDIAFTTAGLVTFDRDGRFATHDATGALVKQDWLRPRGPSGLRGPVPFERASMGGPLVAIDRDVYDFHDHTRWTYRPDDYDVHASSPVHVALAPTGARLAFAHATLPDDKRPSGRGWIVIAVDTAATDAVVARPSGRKPNLDRHWLQTRAEPGPTVFAFSADGARMIHASPESTPHVGAIRIGKDRAYTETHPGGAHAIALDARGIIAAYAYPDAPRRFRIDYLDPEDSQASMIDVIDSLYIEPSLPDVAALAFSPDSHAIACLAKTGAIEIVPVP
jgi:hypothetical protein